MCSSDLLYGGGFLCYFCSLPCISNVTITQNECYGNGAGIYSGNYSYPHFNNCIISDNIGNYGVYNYPEYPGSPNITYSDIWNNQGGNFYNCSSSTGCIDDDPLFIDSLNGDFHLSWLHFPVPDATQSPCIDKGDPNSPPDPDGTVTDMGAFYFNQNVSVDDPQEISSYLLTNYPNPVGTNINNLTVSFSLHKPGKVKIQLFNIKGQLVSTLINEERNIGNHTIFSTVDNLSSGIYSTNLSIDGVEKEISKVVVLR